VSFKGWSAIEDDITILQLENIFETSPAPRLFLVKISSLHWRENLSMQATDTPCKHTIDAPAIEAPEALPPREEEAATYGAQDVKPAASSIMLQLPSTGRPNFRVAFEDHFVLYVPDIQH
jgi:hypothetical protein